MLIHRNSIWRRLSTGAKLFFLCLASMWVISKVFILVCRWTEEPTFVSCTGIIDHMCAEYSRNRISGNLCLELCQNTTSKRFHCEHIDGDGKKVIYFIRDENTKLVLKTNVLNPSILRHNTTSFQSLLVPRTAESLIQYLYTLSQNLLLSNRTFDMLINHLDITPHNVYGAAVSGQSLLNQEEYVMTINYQSINIVPTLYGSCGNFYAVDHLTTDPVLLTNNLKAGWPYRSIGPWEDRRTVAIRLIELAERMDNHNLALCDVKGNNFGFLADGRIGVLDSDTLFTKDALGNILKEDSCMRDTDCSFWDCHGTCNRKSWKCSPTLLNTNFQMMCSKIFRHHSSNAYHGILEDLPEKWSSKIGMFIRRCHRWALSQKENRNNLVGLRKVLLHDQILG